MTEEDQDEGHQQPVFALWPWKVLAAAVPAASVLGAASVFLSEARVNNWDTQTLAVLTAYTLYGASNGFLLGAAIGDFGRSILAMMAGAFTALALSPCYTSPLLLLGVPAITLVMVATLALKWNLKGILDAMSTGVYALFVAAVLSGTILCLLMAVAGLLYALTNSSVWFVLAGVMGLMVANVIFLGRIFLASYRVRSTR